MAQATGIKKIIRCSVAASILLVSGCTGRQVMPEPAPQIEPAHLSAPSGWTQTRGGAGGKIVRVTTLAPTGPGSFEAAIRESGPRIIVFEVGGIIDLGGRDVRIQEPFVTIAGQTAPSPGITFTRGGIGIRTHDVIVQHIRVRPGEAGHQKTSGWEVDGIATSGAHDVIIDHTSVSWSTDENISASGPRFGQGSQDVNDWREGTSRRVTISNNLIAECLSESTHAKGEHSKGSLIHDNATEILIAGNLYASNVERNPLFKGGVHGAVVNNFIFNPGRRAIHYGLVAGEWTGYPMERGRMVVVGNVLRYGADTRSDLPLVSVHGAGDVELFMEDNIARDRQGANVEMVREIASGRMIALDDRPFWPRGLAALPASAVEEYVLQNAGARPWDRDAVDERILREVKDGTNRVIHSENEVGGYPTAAETRRAFNPEDWDLETMQPRSPAIMYGGHSR